MVWADSAAVFDVVSVSIVCVFSSIDYLAARADQSHVFSGKIQGCPGDRFRPLRALPEDLIQFIIIDAAKAFLKRLQEFDGDLGELFLELCVTFAAEMRSTSARLLPVNK